MSHASFAVRQGDPVAKVVELRDLAGRALHGRFDGSELVTARLWVGDDRSPATPPPVVVWSVPNGASLGLIDLDYSGEQTASLLEGGYTLEVLVDGVLAWSGGMEVLPGPDSEAFAPTPLLSPVELRAIVGSWPESVQPIARGTGLRRALSLATEDLYDAITRAYAPLSSGFGHASRSRAIRAALETEGNLIVTTPIRRYVAFRALWYLARFAVTSKDADPMIQRIADHAAIQADHALRRVVATFTTGITGPIALSGPTRIVRG